MSILKADLDRELDRRVTAHRQVVVSAVEGWWGKYRGDAAGYRGASGTMPRARLDGLLTDDLGYAE